VKIYIVSQYLLSDFDETSRSGGERPNDQTFKFLVVILYSMVLASSSGLHMCVVLA